MIFNLPIANPPLLADQSYDFGCLSLVSCITKGERLRKGTLENMRTAKIQTSLHIRSVCSGSFMFAYTKQALVEDLGLIANSRVVVQTGQGLRHSYMP